MPIKSAYFAYVGGYHHATIGGDVDAAARSFTDRTTGTLAEILNDLIRDIPEAISRKTFVIP